VSKKEKRREEHINNSSIYLHGRAYFHLFINAFSCTSFSTGVLVLSRFDGRGGGGSANIRLPPLNSWPDNGNLDKAW